MAQKKKFGDKAPPGMAKNWQTETFSNDRDAENRIDWLENNGYKEYAASGLTVRWIDPKKPWIPIDDLPDDDPLLTGRPSPRGRS